MSADTNLQKETIKKLELNERNAKARQSCYL